MSKRSSSELEADTVTDSKKKAMADIVAASFATPEPPSEDQPSADDFYNATGIEVRYSHGGQTITIPNQCNTSLCLYRGGHEPNIGKYNAEWAQREAEVINLPTADEINGRILLVKASVGRFLRTAKEVHLEHTRIVSARAADSLEDGLNGAVEVSKFYVWK